MVDSGYLATPHTDGKQPLRIGFVMPTFGVYARGLGAREAHRVLARRAESLGFESLWSPDHLALPAEFKEPYPYSESGKFPLALDTPFLEPLAYLSFLAGITDRVKLGTSILVLPLRPAILTAKLLATADVLSGGRVILGGGVGYLKEEMEILGVSFADRGKITDETIAALRDLWTSADPGMEGEIVSYRNMKFEPKPIQPSIPIWLGGHSRPMMRRIARTGDGCIFGAFDFEEFKRQRDLLEDECEKNNRDPSTVEKIVYLTHTNSADDFLRQMEPYVAAGMTYFLGALPYWSNDVSEMFGLTQYVSERLGLSEPEVRREYFVD